MNTQENARWEETIILVDADFADQLVFELSVQLERMLERQMPKIEIAKWMDYIALDGGLRPGDNKIQVLFVYTKPKAVLQNLLPASLEKDLDATSFKDNLGEFQCASFPVEEKLVSRGKLYAQSLEMLLTSQQVKRILLLPDLREYGAELVPMLAKSQDKEITLFSMEAQTGIRCGQEMITYSLMAALGVKGDELR